jgi:hypothetical protein
MVSWEVVAGLNVRFMQPSGWIFAPGREELMDVSAFPFDTGAEVTLRRFWKTVGIMEQPDGESTVPHAASISSDILP